MKRHAWCCGMLLGALAAGTSFGGPLYNASGGAGIGFFGSSGALYSDSYQNQQNTPTGGSLFHFEPGDFSKLVQSSSSAGPGFLQQSTNVSFVRNTVFFPAASTQTANSSAYGEFTVDDMMITGNTGPVTTHLNVFLEGGVNAAAGGGAGSSLPIASGSMEIVVYVNGNLVQAGDVDINASLNAASQYSATGLATGYNNISQTLTTSDFTVPANEFFSLRLVMQTSAQVLDFTDNANSLAGSADFSHTFSLAQSGDVMSLPAGYTLNSAEANIANNQFTLVAAPEPAACLIMIPLGLLCVRRRAASHLRGT